MDAALVAVGAAGGALARWRISTTSTLPTYASIAAINVSGSLALGIMAGHYMSAPTTDLHVTHARPRLVLLACTGFLGSFTTFSTFSLDVVTLLQQGAILRAAAIALGTPALGVGAASAGLAIGRVLRDAKPR